MTMQLRRFFTILLVLALSLLPFSALAESETADTTDTNDAGMPYVLNYFEGTPLDVSLYEGKALYLNFFTGWCTYCMQEMPDLKEVFEAYDPNEVAIILVHVWSGEDASDSAAVVEEFGLQDMILLEDDEMALTNMIGLSGFPTSLFIDKEGYLSSYYPGMMTYDTMSAALEDMGVALRADTNADTTVDTTAAPDSAEVTQ